MIGSSVLAEGTESPHKRTHNEKRTNQEITSKAIEQLIAAAKEGRSETLTKYLRAIGRFIDLFPNPLRRSSLPRVVDYTGVILLEGVF